MELVYEGEQEGPFIVSQSLIGKSVRSLFLTYFPDPEKFKKKPKAKNPELPIKEIVNPYSTVIQWFNDGNMLDVLTENTNIAYEKALKSIPGLAEVVAQYHPNAKHEEKLFLMDFVLHGLAEYSLISKAKLERGLQFKDLFNAMFDASKFSGNDTEWDN
ncbi:MAG: hypothetical protein EAZ06_00975 [Cytophagales bacterium]|nr:MAG: hypothetical protein EAZ06_00975 [Cytophagales bacterium]